MGHDHSSGDMVLHWAGAYDVLTFVLTLGRDRQFRDRLIDLARLSSGESVLDIGCGTGSLALAARRRVGGDARVCGVDPSPEMVTRARRKAAKAGLAVTFEEGSAEALPFPDGTFDAVVCECAFCTFPDKATAAAEMARVLKPGGRIGITDVALDPDRLHHELKTLAGWVACLADARPVDQYVELLADAGLKVTRREAHDDALARMIEQIDARLVAFRMAKVPALESIDFDTARHRTALAAQAVRDGIAGYTLLVAEKP